jgi:hypothetical protein
MSRRRIKAPCFDCGVDTLATGGDWYMVHNHLWKLAWPNTDKASGRAKKKPLSEILCLRCLERRLGRVVTRGDFTAAAINDKFRGRCDFRKIEQQWRGRQSH